MDVFKNMPPYMRTSVYRNSLVLDSIDLSSLNTPGAGGAGANNTSSYPYATSRPSIAAAGASGPRKSVYDLSSSLATPRKSVYDLNSSIATAPGHQPRKSVYDLNSSLLATPRKSIYDLSSSLVAPRKSIVDTPYMLPHAPLIVAGGAPVMPSAYDPYTGIAYRELVRRPSIGADHWRNYYNAANTINNGYSYYKPELYRGSRVSSPLRLSSYHNGGLNKGQGESEAQRKSRASSRAAYLSRSNVYSHPELFLNPPPADDGKLKIFRIIIELILINLKLCKLC